jgi:hypothetical protein
LQAALVEKYRQRYEALRDAIKKKRSAKEKEMAQNQAASPTPTTPTTTLKASPEGKGVE